MLTYCQNQASHHKNSSRRTIYNKNQEFRVLCFFSFFDHQQSHVHKNDTSAFIWFKSNSWPSPNRTCFSKINMINRNNLDKDIITYKVELDFYINFTFYHSIWFFSNWKVHQVKILPKREIFYLTSPFQVLN